MQTKGGTAHARSSLPSRSRGAYGAGMQFRVLGPLEVTGEGGLLALGGPRQRAVLAHLITHANQVVASDTLIDLVWAEEPPEAARNALQSYASHLRKALGRERIEGRSPGYILHLEPHELDAARFEILLKEARNGGGSGRGDLLREALALWRGQAYADLEADQPTLAAEIARLDELRHQAVEERIAADIEDGRHTEVVGELESLTRELPLRERLWECLMLALYRSARPADALGAYERARAVLAEELGVDPSTQLQRLHERILRQDPELELEGSPLRGYRLLEQIGEGAFGVVHRAVQPQVGREVAIKAIHPELANHPDFVRRFEREAQLVARLEHPHIVPLYDYWREPAAAYLVMRFLRGGSLEDLIDQGPLEPSRAAGIFDQIAAALSAAHAQGVVHRDVKPGNVLLDEQGNAYLTDFGVALDVGSPEKTMGTMIRGTPGYLSPEQIRLEPATPQSDVYALGIVLYEMLTGSYPFEETSLQDLLNRHLHDALPNVREARPDLSPAVEVAIARATAKDIADRFSDAPALAAAFRAAIEEAATVQIPRGEIRNPYKGLRAFVEADADDFFGREQVTERLVRRLERSEPTSRFLAVVGPSGSGKSSVVRAGLVPALRRGVLQGSDRWYVIEMLPGAHPFDELESALLRVAVDPPSSLMELLARDELGLADAVDRVLPDPDGELLIVLDQLEEVFTLVHDGDERMRFLDCIRAAVLAPGSRIRVVATLRADFYDQPLSVAGFGDLLAARNEAITPMAAEELELAIVAPAERAGLVVEPMLLAAMIGDVAEQPGALPLVQFALTELAEGAADGLLTIDAYRGVGRVSGALARRADQLFDAMNEDGQLACRQLFLRLVTLGEGSEDTRRRVRRAELLALTDAQTMDAVIEAFGRHRLLSFDRDPSTREPTVEIAHEALLRVWRRLGGWIDEARDDIRTQRQLAAAAAEWQASDRDPSFLLRGARLEQIGAWTDATTLALTDIDRAFVDASILAHDEERAAEQERSSKERALERRSARRLRGLVAVFALAALVAASLTVVATNQSGRAGREADRAERQARIATARELAAAAVANLEVDPELSVLLATEAVETTRSSDGTVLPEGEEALHRALVASRLELEVPGLGGLLAWSSRGVFVTEGPENSGMVDIRDDETGERVLAFEAHDGDINDVAFSPDGSMLATTGDDGRLKVWNASTGRLISSSAAHRSVFGVWGPSFNEDGSLVAAAWSDWEETFGRLRVLDLSTDRVISDVPIAGAIDTAFSPDGERLAVATWWSEVENGAVFDVQSGEEVFGLRGPNHCCPPYSRGVSWSPDGRYIAASSLNNTLIWDAETGRLRDTLLGHAGFASSVAWSQDSSRLVTGGSDGTARVWEVGAEGIRERWSLSAQETRSGIVGVAFSPDGTRVMAGDAAISAVKIWDLGPDGNAEWANLPAAGYPAAVFMPDGWRVVAPTRDEVALTIWDLRTGRNLRTLGPATHFGFQSFDVSPDGSSIAVGGWNTRNDGLGGASAARAWDASSGQELFRFGHELDVNSVAFSPDGEFLVTAAWGGTAKIVDMSGRVIHVLQEESVLQEEEGDGFNEVNDARFSPDGLLVATAARTEQGEGHVRIWDRERGEVIRTIDADASSLDFDPSGLRIATANPEGPAEIWNVESGTRASVLEGQSGGVNDVAFTPDGSRLATANDDGTVRLFDAGTGAQQLVLPRSGCAVEGVDFSPDGAMLASSSGCDGVRIWALDIDDLLKIAHHEVPRQFTDEECRQHLHLETCPAS
jgi:WD40 repeat protein/serine/threonine protein kinase